MNTGPNLPRDLPKPHTARALVTLLAIPVMGVLAYLYGGVAIDAVKAAQYTPTSQLQTAEQRIALTARGQQIFYATAPAIQDKAEFNASCQSAERTAAILGCYYQDRIYLYNIQNAELDGTLEVTAAHEMLHAAYHRLNYFERQRIDAMVEQQYQRVKDQPEISQLMQYYAKSEPGAELDELHSILGTTISDISPELEQYYARYFTDRAGIVALNAKYTAVFSDLSRQADELQTQIDAESAALKTTLATYEADLEQLNLDIESFNARAGGGGFTSQSEFSVALAGVQRRVSAMNARQSALNTQINAYNDMVERLNKIAVHVHTLNQSINGVSAPSGVSE